MTTLEKCRELLANYVQLGNKAFANGGELIGKAPHIAPKAWLHTIFPPATDRCIKNAEQLIGIIPGSYKSFLLQSNGLMLFGSTLYLYGLREKLFRDVSADPSPFEMTTTNLNERPSNLPKHVFMIGGYDWDSSNLCIDKENGKTFLCGPDDATPLFEWPNFDDMIVSEIKRLKKMHNKKGKELDSSKSTLPNES